MSFSSLSVKCLLVQALCLLLGQHVLVDGEPANMIFLMFDDLGRSDIGLFGAEWDTPNLDAFILDSASLSHHYIGYVCSASRSQFLTGRYSFHNGYGTLDVFDHNRLGAIPLSTPTIVEYLRDLGGYQTYGLGKWQLGAVTSENLAVNRGFDHFWGFNGGMEDYTTKVREFWVDFHEDGELSDEWSDGYSTAQYFAKAMELIGDKVAAAAAGEEEGEGAEDKPMFIYMGIQAVHIPYSDSTEYYTQCKKLNKGHSLISPARDDGFDRLGVCENMLAVDDHFGKLMTYLQSTDELKAFWDNTIMIVTSDNGGALDAGSCNYPLRGGKNTFYEGNQRILATVGGGKLPSEQRGAILDGLVSNVDWFPTMLSFAEMIPTTTDHVMFKSASAAAETSLVLDGYNMYDYLMNHESHGSIRDHVLLHLGPYRDVGQTGSHLTKPIEQHTFGDFQEMAIVFYDEEGTLWKYFDATDSSNPVGDPTENSKWCEYNEGHDGTAAGGPLYAMVGYTADGSAGLVSAATSNFGLFDLSRDARELQNLIETEDGDKGVLREDLVAVIEDKLAFYVGQDAVSGNQNSGTLFGAFECLTSQDSEAYLMAVNKAAAEGGWVPYLNVPTWKTVLEAKCTFEAEHPVFQLLTNRMTLPDVLETVDSDYKPVLLNNYVPALARRHFDDFADNFDGDFVRRGKVEESEQGLGHSGKHASAKEGWIIGILASVLTVAVLTALACCIVKRRNRTNDEKLDEKSPLMSKEDCVTIAEASNA